MVVWSYGREAAVAIYYGVILVSRFSEKYVSQNSKKPVSRDVGKALGGRAPSGLWVIGKFQRQDQSALETGALKLKTVLGAPVVSCCTQH